MHNVPEMRKIDSPRRPRDVLETDSKFSYETLSLAVVSVGRVLLPHLRGWGGGRLLRDVATGGTGGRWGRKKMDFFTHTHTLLSLFY